MGDPLTIGNELTANDLGVLPARLLIRLWVGLGAKRRQSKTETKYGQRETSADFHVYPQLCRHSICS
jgi:hypothetical protein